MLSNEVAKVWETNDLPDDTIEINFNGSAGQSFSAWLVKGITFRWKVMQMTTWQRSFWWKINNISPER